MTKCPECAIGHTCSHWNPHNHVCRRPAKDLAPACLLGLDKTKQFKGSVTMQVADAVDSPSHYNEYPVEVIKMIEAIFKVTFGGDYVGQPLWKIAMLGYILGNELKYRLRTGFKDTDKIKEDVMKSLKYKGFRDLYT